MFCTISNWALPVFALPSHRSSEISYFVILARRALTLFQIKALGFDYRKLAREVKESAKFTTCSGRKEEFVNINDLYMDPVSLPEVQPSDVAFLQLSGGTTGLSKLILDT